MLSLLQNFNVEWIVEWSSYGPLNTVPLWLAETTNKHCPFAGDRGNVYKLGWLFVY